MDELRGVNTSWLVKYSLAHPPEVWYCFLQRFPDLRVLAQLRGQTWETLSCANIVMAPSTLMWRSASIGELG